MQSIIILPQSDLTEIRRFGLKKIKLIWCSIIFWNTFCRSQILCNQDSKIVYKGNRFKLTEKISLQILSKYENNINRKNLLPLWKSEYELSVSVKHISQKPSDYMKLIQELITCVSLARLYFQVYLAQNPHN